MMRLKLIACDVFTRELCHCIARSPHTIHPLFFALGQHEHPEQLRSSLQQAIDATEEEETAYDAIVIAYGLCGNAVVGLKARSTQLIIPRAHDCTTILLGSKQAFQCHFGQNPSQSWVSTGYHERSRSGFADSRMHEYLGAGSSWEDLVATYGEENARFLMEQLHPPEESEDLFYIRIPETARADQEAAIREAALARDKKVQTLSGSMALIEAMLNGPWGEDDFLQVPPGQSIRGEYDHDKVMESRPEED